MPKKAELDIAKTVDELETIVAWFESDKIDLDQALMRYERGLKLVGELESYLSQAKNTVEKIERQFGTGANK